MQLPASRQRRVVRGFAGAISALAILATAACSSGGDEPSETPGTDMSTAPVEPVAITVGIIPILDVAPIYLGVEKGIFEAHGLEVTLEKAQGGAAIVPGVVSGQFQFGFSNTTSLILATANDLGVVGVAAGNSTTGVNGADFGSVMTTADSGISSPADLAGKRVAVNTLNNINTSTTNKMVRDAGGDPSTIEYVELAFPDIVPAILNGDVDAGQVVEPFQTIGAGQGLVQVGSNFALTDPNLMIAMYFTSADYAASHPEVVEAFSAAMQESLEYANSHPDEARDILLTYTSLDADGAAAVTLPRWTGTVDTATIQLLAELAVTDGFLSEVPDLSPLIP